MNPQRIDCAARVPAAEEPCAEPLAGPSSALQPTNYCHSADLPGLLTGIRSSLLVSTYQAGQLCTLGTHDGELRIALEPLPLAMGIAIHPRRISVVSKGVIWTLESAGRELATGHAPEGTYDAALLVRSAHVTGSIQAHEMAYVGDELWVVNTLFSCLATIAPGLSFVPRWKPAFVSHCHVPGDRCHLNGLAVDHNGPSLVTAMAETDEPNGWRAAKEKTGVLIDVRSGEVVSRGFAMPHSPRIHGGRIYLLDSGRGQLVTVDPGTGKRDVVSAFPGYTRGLAFFGPYAFVGLSRMRETSVFGGVPLSEFRDKLQCGVGMVDLRTGRQVAAFQFTSGIHEIFDVQVLPEVRNPLLRGPQPKVRQEDEIWLTPPPTGELVPPSSAQRMPEN